MRFRIVFALVPSMVVACAAAPRSPSTPTRHAQSWTELRAEARAARVAKDAKTYAARLDDLVGMSGSFQYIYEAAITDARLDRRDLAIDRLRAIANMGLSVSIDDDPALAKLAGDARMPAIGLRMKQNAAPIANATVARALPKDDLIPEGVAFDLLTKTFFVSSVRKNEILAIAPDGQIRDFVTSGADGVASIGGLAVHGDRLWATTADLPQSAGHDDKAPRASAVIAYDTTTGKAIQRVELPAKEKHALTDIAVASDGVVFASDAIGGMLYELRPGAAALTPFVAAGEFTSPQTPAPTPDGSRVLVPDYGRGIAVVDRASHAVTWLAHADDVAIDGVDGMVLDRLAIYAVQNGTSPARVVRFTLDAAFTRVVRADVLEQSTPGFGDPTHCTLADGALYVLVSAGWNRFGDDGAPVPNAPPDAPALWRLERTAAAAR